MGAKAEIKLMTRSNIVALHLKGFSTRIIARSLNISQSAVVRTIQRHKQTGTHSTRARSGRPPGETGNARAFKKQPLLKKQPSALKWKRIPTEKRSAIVTLQATGLSTRLIAAQLGMSQSTVVRTIKRFEATGSILNPYNR